MKNLIVLVHRVAAIAGFLIILTFFVSTLIVELFGEPHSILAVKTFILYAIWVLVPTMAVTGMTGMKMAKKAKAGPIGSKKKRMPFIALNGLFVLIPSAIYLHHLASLGQFDTVFYSIQAIELIAGLTNLTLMGLNMRDGRKLKHQSR